VNISIIVVKMQMKILYLLSIIAIVIIILVEHTLGMEPVVWHAQDHHQVLK
jgi:hypothetical protein